MIPLDTVLAITSAFWSAHETDDRVNGASEASVTVIGFALLVTVDEADAMGFVVAVFRLALATPFAPVNVNVPVPPADCLLIMTLVSGKLSARSMLSPPLMPPLSGPAQVIEKVSEVMPVPVNWTEPQAVLVAVPGTQVVEPAV